MVSTCMVTDKYGQYVWCWTDKEVHVSVHHYNYVVGSDWLFALEMGLSDVIFIPESSTYDGWDISAQNLPIISSSLLGSIICSLSLCSAVAGVCSKNTMHSEIS